MSKIKNLIILSILFVLSFMLVGCFSVDELDYIRFETQPKTVFLKDEGIELSVIVKLTSETSERAPYSLVYDKEGKTSQAISGFQLTGFDTTEVGTRIATLAYTYQGSTAKLFINYTVVLEDVELDFAGGTGTENDPFIIANRQHMQNISKYYSSKKYYKVADFVETIDASNWTSVNINGSFDGNGVTFENLDRTLFGSATDSVQSVFKNFTIDDAYVTGGGSFHVGAVVKKVYDNILFENVVVHGKVEGGVAASFIGYGNGATKPQEFKFVNCYSDATIVALSQIATGFIAHPYCTDGSSIVIQDSKFEGVMYHLDIQHTRYFTGNDTGNISVTTIYSSGYSVANLYTNAPTTAGTTVYPKEADHLGIRYTKSANTLNKNTLEKPDIGEIFSVTKEDGATMAKAIFTISPHDINDFGSYTSVYLSENCELDGTVFKTNQIRYFYITINGDATPSTGISDNTFNVVNSYYGKNHAGAFVTIVQYDANGSILMISEVQIAEKTI